MPPCPADCGGSSKRSLLGKRSTDEDEKEISKRKGEDDLDKGFAEALIAVPSSTTASVPVPEVLFPDSEVPPGGHRFSPLSTN